MAFRARTTKSLWPEDPWYRPGRDPVTRVLEGRKGQPVRELEQLTDEVRRDIDVEYMKRAKAFLKAEHRREEAVLPLFQPLNDAPADDPARRVRGQDGPR